LQTNIANENRNPAIKKHLSLLLVFTSTIVFAQEKKDFTISLTTGIFNSPYYTNAANAVKSTLGRQSLCWSPDQQNI
jgi:hypothetical protein